jgi:DUF1365 family protein
VTDIGAATDGGPVTEPALYEVSIGHRRVAPVEHSFRYRSYMWAFDVDRPPRLPPWARPLAAWRATDHVDVRSELAAQGIEANRIVVLTNLRVLGYVFNPITVYWCYDAAGELVAHAAEVHNTYGGRHAYVLPRDAQGEHLVSKAMYVSPFYAVDGCYRIRISEPTDTVSVSVVLERAGQEPFRALLTGRRVPASARNLARNVIRFPAAPLRGRALIQLQGLRLWRRGLEVQQR